MSYYLIHCWGDKGVHTFSKDISQKVNIMSRLEFKLTYFEAAVQYFNHYTMGTHHHLLLGKKMFVTQFIFAEIFVG